MADAPKIKGTPGLKWSHKGGKWLARWRARSDIVSRGYPTRSAVIWTGTSPTLIEATSIKDHCERLQREMLSWSKYGDHPAYRLGYVYFVTDETAIKIGYSLDVNGRLVGLQAVHHAKLRIISYFVGIKCDEKALHQHFKDLRLRGEWFQKSVKIDNMIALLESARGLLHSRCATIRDAINGKFPEIQAARVAGESDWRKSPR